jgi:hypothetical protein
VSLYAYKKFDCFLVSSCVHIYIFSRSHPSSPFSLFFVLFFCVPSAPRATRIRSACRPRACRSWRGTRTRATERRVRGRTHRCAATARPNRRQRRRRRRRQRHRPRPRVLRKTSPESSAGSRHRFSRASPRRSARALRRALLMRVRQRRAPPAAPPAHRRHLRAPHRVHMHRHLHLHLHLHLQPPGPLSRRRHRHLRPRRLWEGVCNLYFILFIIIFSLG